MKKAIAAVATAIALASVAGQAQAASPEQRIAALEKRAAALDKRVKKLEKSLNDITQGVIAIGLLAVLDAAYSQCLTTATADAFAGTWSVVDQIAQATQAGKVYFGPQTPVSDFESCTNLKLTRQQTVPPSVVTFSALTTLLGDLQE